MLPKRKGGTGGILPSEVSDEIEDSCDGCFVCGSQFRASLMRNMNGNNCETVRGIATHLRFQNNHPNRIIVPNSRLCANCHISVQNIASQPNNRKLPVILLRGCKACFLCDYRDELTSVNFEARLKIFIDTGKFMEHRGRACSRHFIHGGNFISPAFYGNIRAVEKPVVFKDDEATQWIEALRKTTIQAPAKLYENDKAFDDADFKTLTGFRKIDFENISDACKDERYQRHKVSKKDLFCFLVKMHQGLSDDFLHVMFHYTTRQSVSMAITVVRTVLMKAFVPIHLGVTAHPRSDFLRDHVTEFANKIYNGGREKVAILIPDGTYIPIPKSSNFTVLRRSYCFFKSKHLLKPMMIVSVTGRILTVLGPYFSDSSNNDAAILIDEMKNDLQGLRQWLQPNDILIVDRGFRDALDFLEEMGIKSKMPPYLKKGQSQFSTEEGNEARLITNSRWIVEARNGHIKSKFKFFRDCVPLVHLTQIGDFFRICCALINAFMPEIYMETGTPEIAAEMIKRVENVNVVKAKVEESGYKTRRTGWKEMTGMEIPEFPRLNINDLRDITLGVYQIKLAKSYVQDKSQRESEYTFKMLLDEPGFLKVEVYSRFRNAVKHTLWIAFIPENTEKEEEENPILGYYCTCRSGARTLGCCAHVASVLWYLSFARYLPNLPVPKSEALTTIDDSAHRF